MRTGGETQRQHEKEPLRPICSRKLLISLTPKTGQRVPRFGDLWTPTFRQNIAVQAESHDSGRNWDEFGSG
jgi:hypothetical protein